MKLKPGTIDKYENSMAQAMEKAFLKTWPQIMYPNDPEDQEIEMPNITNHLRMMFIAIAQGIVRHLVDNAGAFEITVKEEGEVDGDNSVTEENSEEVVDQVDLHKHIISTPSYDEGYTDCPDLGGYIERFVECYKNHKHQIDETDTHRHFTITTIESDDSLFDLDGD